MCCSRCCTAWRIASKEAARRSRSCGVRVGSGSATGVSISPAPRRSAARRSVRIGALKRRASARLPSASSTSATAASWICWRCRSRKGSSAGAIARASTTCSVWLSAGASARAEASRMRKSQACQSSPCSCSSRSQRTSWSGAAGSGASIVLAITWEAPGRSSASATRSPVISPMRSSRARSRLKPISTQPISRGARTGTATIW